MNCFISLEFQFKPINHNEKQMILEIAREMKQKSFSAFVHSNRLAK